MTNNNNNLQAIENPKNIKDQVLNKVVQLQYSGGLTVPAGYDPTNALHSAWLIFEGDKKLMSTTPVSQANALFKMVALGLDPGKQQGYFIPYGNAVQFQSSYHGNTMILKRDAGAITVDANVIYKGDDFKFEIDPKTGKRVVTKHEQTLESLDSKEPVGAWVSITFEDERMNHVEIMTYQQIKQAWLQSSMLKNEESIKHSKTHNNFQEEMIKKTVINRASKRFRNTTGVSTNEKLIEEIDETTRKQVFDAEIKNEQAAEELDFDTVEEVNTTADAPVEPEFVNVDTETGEIKEAHYAMPAEEARAFDNTDVRPITDEEAPF